MEFCVITDIKNGIGNILSEILVGLFFTKHLSLITGKNYNYYGLLTDKCFNNHHMIYNTNHKENSLPHPLNLSAIFPHINFLVRLPDNMTNYHYLSPVDINEFKNISRLNIRVDSIKQILLELVNNKDILDKIIFNESITKYTLSKYFPTNKSIAIHVRVRQMGDYMCVELPNFQWYKNAIDTYISEHGNPDKIFLITGISTAESKKSHFKNYILNYLESICDNVIDVINEPYYVDMSIISLCGTKIITNSSFSLFASFIELKDDKIVFYPDLLDKQFNLNGCAILRNFIKLP